MVRSDLPERLGAALAAMRSEAGISQEQVARALGVGQRVVSRLEWGDQRAHLDQVLTFEQACGRPPGWSLRQAGIIVDPVDVEGAIRQDAHLTNDTRDLLLATYRAAVSRSSGRRSAASAKRPAKRAKRPPS